MPRSAEYGGEKFEIEIIKDECRVEVSYQGLKGEVRLNSDAAESGQTYLCTIESQGDVRVDAEEDALNYVFRQLLKAARRQARRQNFDPDTACQALIQAAESRIKD